ncbi:hypothetical protein RJT34_32993 [Clitoria ternatea]|uniref:Uncharacterized protein n=1 Tax=Clitoria ternatea TaxID=43366 RepID=A0AAN9I537_CLITE
MIMMTMVIPGVSFSHLYVLLLRVLNAKLKGRFDSLAGYPLVTSFLSVLVVKLHFPFLNFLPRISKPAS